MATYRRWWPAVDERRPLLAGYHAALEATYGLEARAAGQRVARRSAACADLGPADSERVKAGYERLLSDQVPWTMGEWFGVLTPILLGPGRLTLAGRSCPGMGVLLTASTVTERSLSELITFGDCLNSITPFIDSMVMWANVPDQPTRTVRQRAVDVPRRVGLTGRLAPDDRLGDRRPVARARWGMAGGHLGLDVYELVRWLTSLGGTPARAGGRVRPAEHHRDHDVVDADPGRVGQGHGAATKEAGADDDAASIAGWVTMGVTAVGLWLGAGLPVAKALSTGGGWMSWFATDDLPSLRGALAGDGNRADTLDGGRRVRRLDAVVRPGDGGAGPGRPALPDRRSAAGQGVAGDRARPSWRSPRGAPSSRSATAPPTPTSCIGPGADGRRHRDRADRRAGVQAAPADAEVAYDLPWPATVPARPTTPIRARPTATRPHRLRPDPRR